MLYKLDEFVCQNPEDAQFSVDELCDMVGRDGEHFSSYILYYASSLRGTCQYWMQQRRRLIAMVDALGIPTVFSPTVLLIFSGLV